MKTQIEFKPIYFFSKYNMLNYFVMENEKLHKYK